MAHGQSSSKFKCPACGHGLSYITDSRIRHDGAVKLRRRTCYSCQRKYTTIEIVGGSDAAAFPDDNIERMRRSIARLRMELAALEGQLGKHSGQLAQRAQQAG